MIVETRKNTCLFKSSRPEVFIKKLFLKVIFKIHMKYVFVQIYIIALLQ